MYRELFVASVACRTPPRHPLRACSSPYWLHADGSLCCRCCARGRAQRTLQKWLPPTRSSMLSERPPEVSRSPGPGDPAGDIPANQRGKEVRPQGVLREAGHVAIENTRACTCKASLDVTLEFRAWIQLCLDCSVPRTAAATAALPYLFPRGALLRAHYEFRARCSWGER